MLALIGFTLMIILMIVLIKSWVSPPVAFIGLPLIAAVIAGFSVADIGGFIGIHVKHSSVVCIFYFIFYIDG